MSSNSKKPALSKKPKNNAVDLKELKAKREKMEICNGLARCVSFALGALKDRPILDSKTDEETTIHQWFKKELRKAGYDETVDKIEKAEKFENKHKT